MAKNMLLLNGRPPHHTPPVLQKILKLYSCIHKKYGHNIEDADYRSTLEFSPMWYN